MPEAIVEEAKIYDERGRELAWLNDQRHRNLAKDERHM